MKKTILAVVAAAAVTVAGPIASAEAAANPTPGCVSKAEYKKVKKGWTQSKVHKTFGTKGKRQAHASSGGYYNEIRTYKGCGGDYNVVSISFSRVPRGALKLDAKSAVWLG